MVPVKALIPVMEVLSGCNIGRHGNIMIFTDPNGEMVGEIDLDGRRFALYADYDYYSQVAKRLQSKGISLDETEFNRREAERTILEMELADQHQIQMENKKQK